MGCHVVPSCIRAPDIWTEVAIPASRSMAHELELMLSSCSYMLMSQRLA